MSPMVKLPLALEYALLGFLRDHPIHAYEMHQRLRKANAVGLVWRLKQSQLYALLTRLEVAGYITTTMELQGTRPPRKMLHLTPAGETAFFTWIITPVAHGRDFRQEFLAKLFFAHQTGPDHVKTLLRRQKTSSQAMLAEMQRHADAQAPDRPFARLVYQFRISQLVACLSWLDTCVATLVSTPYGDGS